MPLALKISNLPVTLLQFYTLIISMRRRSGAIHSDSEQGFAMLAQRALDQNGLFYDEKFGSDSQMTQPEFKQNSANENSKALFLDFDFDQGKEFERDERDMYLQANKQPIVNIKNVVVCDQVQPIVRLLSAQEDDRNEERDVDLVVRRLKMEAGRIGAVKYWVINLAMLDSPFAQIYIDSAAEIYWVSRERSRLPAAVLVSQSELHAKVEANELRYSSK